MDQYETAYKDLVQRLGGAIDGVETAAEHGSAAAARDAEIWDQVYEIVGDVADEHDVEGIWDMPAGYDPTQDSES
jgi:hypothetical protein